MKSQRLTILAVVAVATALFGVVAAVLVVSGPLSALESAVAPVPTAALVSTPTREPTPATALESYTRPGTPERKQGPTAQMGSFQLENQPGVSSSGQETFYTWHDGDTTLTVVLQDDLVVQETADNTSDDVVVVKGFVDSIVQKRVEHDLKALPVFRPESGGGLMMLPGGVLLALDPEWARHLVESFFSQNNIEPDRVTELDFMRNGFLVDTSPGFPSLELANQLAPQEGVMISSPNWWREVEAQ